MHTGDIARKIYKPIRVIDETVAWIGYVSLVGIIVIVLVDVSGRYVFNMPLRGSVELVQQSMGAFAGFAIMYAALKKGHVALDLILRRFSRRTQRTIQSIFSVLGFLTCAALTYQVFAYKVVTALEITDTTAGPLYIRTAPVLLMLALAMLLCSLTLLLQAFHPEALNKAGEEKGVSEQ